MSHHCQKHRCRKNKHIKENLSVDGKIVVCDIHAKKVIADKLKVKHNATFSDDVNVKGNLVIDGEITGTSNLVGVWNITLIKVSVSPNFIPVPGAVTFFADGHFIVTVIGDTPESVLGAPGGIYTTAIHGQWKQTSDPNVFEGKTFVVQVSKDTTTGGIAVGVPSDTTTTTNFVQFVTFTLQTPSTGTAALTTKIYPVGPGGPPGSDPQCLGSSVATITENGVMFKIIPESGMN